MEILITGCGLAGLSAAITAAENGDRVKIISPYPPERSQSVLASGGTNAALNTKGEDDSWEQHAADTIKAGCCLADETAVQQMAESAPAMIRELAGRGIVFSRDENGDPDLRYFGGQKKKRTVFSKAGIGKQLVSGLSSILLKYIAEGKVELLTNVKFVKPILADGKYAGIITENTATGELQYLQSDVLITATGGIGGLFGNTTGSRTSDGAVTASLFRAGAEMANLEMIQYHPTTIATAQKRMLISEAARGEGGRLFTMKDGQRWYFMEDWYGERGNLMPRDVVSQCIYKVCNDLCLGIDGKQQVGLDLTHLDEYTVHDKLKEITDTTKLYLDLDPLTDVIPVYPGIHYFMGGIYVDRFHRTTIPGILAAGECACIYHGANRLGGNSTLGAIYGGRIAAQSAAEEREFCSLNAEEKKSAEELARLEIGDLMRSSEESAVSAESEPAAKIMADIQTIMNGSLGIVRNGVQLAEGLTALKAMKSRSLRFDRYHLSEDSAVSDFIELGAAMLESAIFRKESRGAQMRSDYPETDDANFRKTVCASYKNGEIAIRADEIGRLLR